MALQEEDEALAIQEACLEVEVNHMKLSPKAAIIAWSKVTPSSHFGN